jgi:hypothetical protein
VAAWEAVARGAQGCERVSARVSNAVGSSSQQILELASCWRHVHSHFALQMTGTGVH